MADKKPRVAKDPAPLAKTLITALWAYLVGELVWGLANIVEFRQLAAYDAEEPISYWEGLPRSPLEELVITGGSLFALVIFLVAGFLTLKWIYRVNLNAIVLAPSKEVSPAWSVGWYFVPLANLIMPFKAMRETWQISLSPEGWRSVAVPPLLRWWWGLFLVSNILDNVGARLSIRAETVSMLMLSNQISLVGVLLAVPASLILMTIVRNITESQSALVGPSSVF